VCGTAAAWLFIEAAISVQVLLYTQYIRVVH
jgi:hypothetical protein